MAENKRIDVTKLTDIELNELLVNAINDRESYPSESTAKRALWLDEVVAKAQDETHKRTHTNGRPFHEVPYPGEGIIRTYKYSVSYNHGKSWEDMYLTDSEVDEIKDENEDAIIR